MLDTNNAPPPCMSMSLGILWEYRACRGLPCGLVPRHVVIFDGLVCRKCGPVTASENAPAIELAETMKLKTKSMNRKGA